jgi:hypothetical protein
MQREVGQPVWREVEDRVSKYEQRLCTLGFSGGNSARHFVRMMQFERVELKSKLGGRRWRLFWIEPPMDVI